MLQKKYKSKRCVSDLTETKIREIEINKHKCVKGAERGYTVINRVSRLNGVKRAK